jgi:putative thioredoxin
MARIPRAGGGAGGAVPPGSPGAPGGLNVRGAVDLAALAQAREAQAAAAERARQRAEQAASGDADEADAAASPTVIDVTEATFQAEVVDRSYQVPVVIDFWADWCQPCKQLSPILERLAADDAGRWVLAKIDVDADQRLGQAFGVQSIPSLFAVVAGQPIPLFQGALPEDQVRQVLDELLRLAAENGVAGAAGDAAAPSDGATEPPVDPDLDAAADAVAGGDLDAAAAAYRRLLDRVPGDPDGIAGLALVGIMQRVQGIDAVAALEAATNDSDDANARLVAADVLVLSGRAQDAFDLLIEGVRRASGDDRTVLRDRLLELFAVVGPDDPAVAPARLALANALF